MQLTDSDSVPPVSDQPIAVDPDDSRNAITFARSVLSIATVICVLAWLCATLAIVVDGRPIRLSRYLMSVLPIVPASWLSAIAMRRTFAVSISTVGLQAPDTRGRRAVIRFSDPVEVRYRRFWFIRQIEIRTPLHPHPLVLPLFMGVPRLMQALEEYAGPDSPLVRSMAAAFEAHR